MLERSGDGWEVWLQGASTRAPASAPTPMVLLRLYLYSAQIPAFKHLQISGFKHLLKAACPDSSHGSSCMYHPVPRAHGHPEQRSATILRCPLEQGATRIRLSHDIYGPGTLW